MIGTELLEDGLSVLTAAIQQQAAGAFLCPAGCSGGTTELAVELAVAGELVDLPDAETGLGVACEGS